MLGEKDLLKLVKFDESEARIFKIEEYSFALTYFDAQCVANYYNTDLAEAVEKICESNDVICDEIVITLELLDTVEEVEAEIKKQKKSLELYKKQGNRQRVAIYQNNIPRLEKRKKELMMKREREKN